MPVNKASLLERARTTNSIRTLADAGVIKEDRSYKIPLDLLEEEEGYNPRDYDSPECVEKIRAFADAYKAGRYVPPIEFRVMNGHVLVVEGHQRRRGALLARSEGAEIPWLFGFPFTGDDNDRDARVFTAEDGLKHTPLGLAVVIQRMKNRGLANREIAERIARTPQLVEQYLVLARIPSEAKTMVADGQVDAQAAIALFRKHGDNLVQVLKGLRETVKQEAQTAPENGRPKGGVKAAKPLKAPKVTVAAIRKLEEKQRSTPPLRTGLTPVQLQQVAVAVDAFARVLGGDELLAELREDAGEAANDHVYTLEVAPSQVHAFMEAWALLQPLTFANAA
ncbi:ParB/RepB/Spo0J family partition protein [Paraburkholderia dinghuensis]|uniref:ParB/Sulfiredoxin domain-containing protein n=1 Tax=Paraburkholderia dinghuensis TaxID=2305225 RepID=A0A3N6N757_9BURK|nr:hypothetical protein [Paraburkholderia dinghuensis]RQH06601.1 hypothetical protein D1Y85_12070 [Paraburkholderia dinghuensis]